MKDLQQLRLFMVGAMRCINVLQVFQKLLLTDGENRLSRQLRGVSPLSSYPHSMAYFSVHSLASLLYLRAAGHAR